MVEPELAPAADEAVEPAGTRRAAEPGAGSSASQQELSATERRIRELDKALAAAAARERVLAHELQHRVRNMLATIRSIYRRSRENGASQEEFAEHFEGRLNAIARYQAYVDEPGSPGIEVEDMLRNELLGANCLDGPSCTIAGPAVFLRQKLAELIGLAIHELATNSIKFGALAQDGKLAIEWSVINAPQGRRLRFRWTEAGVSVVTSAPRQSGFGRQLIEEALPYQLGATTSFDLRPGGLECSILLPLPQVESTASDQNERADEEPLLLPREG